MKTTTTFLIGIALLLGGYTSFAQVGLNNPNPDPSSVLDVKASDRGVLIPRMSTGQRNAMAIGTPTPAQGLLVFDTDLNRIYFWDGAKWRPANVVTADSTGTNEVVRVSTRMSVGTTYKTKQPATNGLIVEGNTSIGTDDPNGNKLKVTGTSHLNGNTTVTGDLTVTGQTTTNTATVTGTLTANDYAHTGTNKNGPIPSGGIIMWSGSNASIPSGWALCDGSNGTPDLRNRFVVGSGTGYATGNTGGSDSITLTAAQMPAHSHSGTTSSNGSHSHNMEGTDANGLSNRTRYISGSTTVDLGFGGGSDSDPNDTRWRGLHNTDTQGNHTHTFTTSSEGGSDGFDNRPKYYALAFIMKL